MRLSDRSLRWVVTAGFWTAMVLFGLALEVYVRLLFHRPMPWECLGC